MSGLRYRLNVNAEIIVQGVCEVAKQKPAILYKAQYKIDITLTNGQILETDDDEFLRRGIRVNLVSAKRASTSHRGVKFDEELNQKLDYVEKNFPEAAFNLYCRMLYLESLISWSSHLDVRRTSRNAVAEQCAKMESKRVKTSNPIPRGRTPNRDSFKVMWKGIGAFDEIVMIARNICRKRGESNFNKTRLAEEMFPNSSNPLRDLRGYLSKFGIDFVHIEEMILTRK